MAAEMTAEIDGQTGTQPATMSDTAPTADASSAQAPASMHVNDESAIGDTDAGTSVAPGSGAQLPAAETVDTGAPPASPPSADASPAAGPATSEASDAPTASVSEAAAEAVDVESTPDSAAPSDSAPTSDAPAATSDAPAATSDAPAATPDAPAAEAAAAPAAITPDAERPAVGPKILGVAADPKPLPAVKATLPTRKRRRRPSASERHRRAFFSALTDLRRGGPAATAAPVAEHADEGEAEATPVAEPTADAPVADAPSVETASVQAPAVEADAPEAAAPVAEPAVDAPPAPDVTVTVAETAPAAVDAPAGAADPAADTSAPAEHEPDATGDRSPTSPARVTAAIERVGGAEIIKEALKPKQDEKGQPLKWAAVCAQAAEGLKPGDPVFNAWVRLAATPVREVKAQLPRPPEAERSSSRGEGSGGRRPGAQRSGGRTRRDDRPSRSEYASHAQDGTFRKSIRIVTGHDEDQERRERERNRKEQREAKRRAERERLARLGY
jgi:hypothetical protein